MLPNNVYLRVFYCYFIRNLGILCISTVIFSIQFSLSMLETYIYIHVYNQLHKCKGDLQKAFDKPLPCWPPFNKVKQCF